MTTDLGIGSEFVPMIAHSIREQLCQARLNFDEALQAPLTVPRPLRDETYASQWAPEVHILTEEELGKLLKEKERSSRYFSLVILVYM